jgi:autotransporter-associated beta strand protein
MSLVAALPGARGDILTWTGAKSVNWSTAGADTNWKNNAGGTSFSDGDNVKFDDTGANTDIKLTTDVKPASIVFDNSKKDYSVTTALPVRSILGATSLKKTGTGTLTLNSANGYTGGTELAGGTLVLGSGAAINSSKLQVTAASTLLTGNKADVVVINNTFAANLTVGGPKVLAFGDTQLKGGDITLTVKGGGDVQFLDTISEDGMKRALIRDGTGVLTLKESNTFSGGMVLKGGTNRLGDSLGFGTGDLTIIGGAAIEGTKALTVPNKVAIQGEMALQGKSDLTFSGDMTIKGSQTVYVSPGMNATFTGTIFDELTAAGKLLKAGKSTLTLKGNSVYSGGTSVGNGTLVVDNDRKGSGTGSGTVTIGKGGTLEGNGSIGGKVEVEDGGRDRFKGIRPGKSPGELEIGGGLTVHSGGTYVWQLGANTESGPGTSFSRLLLTGGDLDIQSGAVLSLLFVDAATAPNASDSFWQSAHTWMVIALTGTATNLGMTDFNSGDILTGSTLQAGSFSTSLDARGDVLLNYTPSPTPEPSTLALALLGVSCLGVHALRRARRAPPG